MASTFVVLSFAACSDAHDPQAIIDRAIAAHGGEVFEHSIIDFDLRDRHYRATRDGGRFTYERIYADSLGRIHDVMTNDSTYRERNGAWVPIADALRRSIESGTNSSIYFALLPYKLNDPAVRKRYIGETVIDGTSYHEIEVTFMQEGGGRDHDDRFVYWINQDTNTMDYLAYRFYVDGGGTRFREAVHPRTIEGIRFADYINYTSDSLGTAIEHYDQALAGGQLEKISEIMLENITVQPLSNHAD